MIRSQGFFSKIISAMPGKTCYNGGKEEEG